MMKVQVLFSVFLFPLLILSPRATAQLSTNYYASTCPNLENLVRSVVAQKMAQTPIAAPATLRLFFHDCFVQGCDASVMIMKSNGDDEFHNPEDSTLKPDGFFTVMAAKAVVDSDPRCTNKVSCADILTLAARDAVFLSGGPYWQVELGRYDGKISTRNSVNLPTSGMSWDQMNQMFASNGLSQTDFVALSGAHTLGATNCIFVTPRLYPNTDQSIDPGFAFQLKNQCPPNSFNFVFFDSTVNRFDNLYFQMLQQRKGVLASDEVLYTDPRSQGTVNLFAANQGAFFQAFTIAMLKLGRVGIKGPFNGEIRRDCRFTN